MSLNKETESIMKKHSAVSRPDIIMYITVIFKNPV